MKSCDPLEVWTVRPISRGRWTVNTNQVLGKVDAGGGGGTVSFGDTESISTGTRSDCEHPTPKVLRSWPGLGFQGTLEEEFRV